MTKIYIASVEEVKRGVGKKGPWVKYQITDQQGTKYSSFQDKYLSMVGMEVEVEVEDGQYGKTIVEQRQKKSYSGGKQSRYDDPQLAKIIELLEKLIELQG